MLPKCLPRDVAKSDSTQITMALHTSKSTACTGYWVGMALFWGHNGRAWVDCEKNWEKKDCGQRHLLCLCRREDWYQMRLENNRFGEANCWPRRRIWQPSSVWKRIFSAGSYHQSSLSPSFRIQILNRYFWVSPLFGNWRWVQETATPVERWPFDDLQHDRSVARCNSLPILAWLTMEFEIGNR